MDMSVHQRPRAQGRERSRRRNASIAGLVTLACLIAVPVELLELVVASIGLSELLPVLAPPIGWSMRIALALCGAAIAAAISWGKGRDDAPVTIGRGGGDDGPGAKGNGIMGWTQNLGLHHLARLARGDDGHVEACIASAPKLRGPAFRKRDQVSPVDLLARNRKDMHPDAPPRAPLIVSRDLAPITELTVVESGPDTAPPPPAMPCASPIRDTTNDVRPRPLPRSPAPLSDSDISWVRGLLADRDTAPAQEANASAPTEVALGSVAGTGAAGYAVDGAPSLLSLIDRFEQGVAQRVALRDAADAMDRVEESMTGQPEPAGDTHSATKHVVDDLQAEPLAMDMALNAALETLRKLSVKALGR